MMQLRIMKTLFIIIIMTMMFPKEGHVSGSFSAVYGQEDYIISFDNQRHKIYFPETDVNALYDEFCINLFKSLEDKHAAIVALLDKAKAKQLPLARMHLAWPEVALFSVNEIDAMSPSSYPLVLALPIEESDEGGLYYFKVAVTAPVKVQDLEWFMTRLKSVLLRKAREADFYDEELGEVPEGNKILQDFVYPHVTRKGEKYALYAGALIRMRSSALAYYTNQLDALLNKCAPALEKVMQEEVYEKEIKKLLAIAKIAGDENLGSGWFNPYGPIHDQRGNVQYFRPRWQTSNAIVTALVGAKKNPAGELTNQITAVLEEHLALAPDQMRSLRTDLMIMQLDQSNHRQERRFEVDQIDKPRMEKALTGVLTHRKKSKNDKNSAVAALEDMVGSQTPTETVQAIAGHYKSLKPDYSEQMQPLRVLGKIQTATAAQALLDLYTQASLSDSGDIYFLRQEMLASLKKIGHPAIAPLEKALGQRAIQNEEKRSQELKAVLETIQRK